MDAPAAWQLSGTYLESCNCEAICPCRRIGGVAGGRSTHGLCLGTLTWWIEQGRSGDTDLSGLGMVIVSRYHDDEPGFPWTYALFVDGRGRSEQWEELVAIFTGGRGGTPLEQFPWAWKPSTLVGWEPAEIAIDHAPGRGSVQVLDRVSLTIRGPVEDAQPVTCVIPGHHRAGREVYTELLDVASGGPARVPADRLVRLRVDLRLRRRLTRHR